MNHLEGGMQVLIPILGELSVKSGWSAYNGSSVTLSAGLVPGEILMGDSKHDRLNGGTIVGPKIPINPLVKDVFFAGLYRDPDGTPGRFTYDGLTQVIGNEGNRKFVTTAPSPDTSLPKVDLELTIRAGNVVVRTPRGPGLNFTREEWEVFTTDVQAGPLGNFAEIRGLKPKSDIVVLK